MKMTKEFFVFLLVYMMAFYPFLGSLANASSIKEVKGQQVKISRLSDVAENTKAMVQETYGKLPLSFIRNNGQMAEKVKFYEKGSGHTTFFTKEGVYLSLIRSQKSEVRKESSTDSSSLIASDQWERSNLKDKIASSESTLSDKARFLANTQNDKSEGVRNGNPRSEIVKLIPLNANKNPEIIAEGKQESKVNYFIGNDPKKWKTNIPTYNAVVYKEIYKNIDMKFYGNNRQLEYDIIVKPKADPSKIMLSYEGIEGLKITETGDLEIALKEGKVIQKRPYIYQEVNGKKVEVDGKFKIFSSTPTIHCTQLCSYGFEVVSYNKDYPLIIDPILVYSTYLGGNREDYSRSIAVDTAGNAYVAGFTSSTDFPIVAPIQGTSAGGSDVFVTKISASGNSLIYSTYLGGSGYDGAEVYGGYAGVGIAVDIFGNAYVTGRTSSTDFPIVAPIQGTSAGGSDVFVTKISASGNSLIYSTYLGGSGWDEGHSIAVDVSGSAYITGFTGSINFPTASPIQTTLAGYDDAFVAKINPSGSSLVYSTYLGGSSADISFSIAVDTSGNAYVTGGTISTDFPTVSPIYGKAGDYWYDAFVTKINAAGSAIVYSTYLGGSSEDIGIAIAVDAAGNAYVTGYTGSTDFPIASPIYGSRIGYWDIFITKINISGNSLIYSTYLGGSYEDYGFGIAVDTFGNAYVTGLTFSGDFPTASTVYSLCGGFDAFITKINATGNNLLHSTCLGGSYWDYGTGIAVDTSGNVSVTGVTYSRDFPTVSPIDNICESCIGFSDAFIAKIGGAISVQIDIKPGSFPNSIKLQDTGNIPMAIFGTTSFDTRTIDVATLELNWAGVRVVKGKGYLASYEDINGDSFLDLVVQFIRDEVQLTVGDTSATVTGKTLDGILIQGTDSVKVIE